MEVGYVQYWMDEAYINNSFYHAGEVTILEINNISFAQFHLQFYILSVSSSVF